MVKELRHRDRGCTGYGGIRGKFGQADVGRLVEFGDNPFVDDFACGVQQGLSAFGDDIAENNAFGVERIENRDATVADVPSDLAYECLGGRISL